MLKEAIQEITGLAKTAAGAANKTHVVRIEGLPRTAFMVDDTGTITEKRLPPPQRRHQLNSVDQIPGFVTRVEAWERNPSIWYSREKVSLIIDDGPDDDRRDAAVVVLEQAPEFKTLVGGLKVDQVQFARLLRTTLFDTLEPNERAELLDILKEVRFTMTNTVTGRSEHGRESLGREIDGDFQTSANKTPESLVFRPRVFTDRAVPYRAELRVAIEIINKDAAFQLYVIGRDAETAVDSALDALHETLTAQTQVPIHFGKPRRKNDDD